MGLELFREIPGLLQWRPELGVDGLLELPGEQDDVTVLVIVLCTGVIAKDPKEPEVDTILEL